MPLSHIFHFTGNLQLKREAALLLWQKAFREKHGDLNLSSCHITDITAEQLAAELSTPPFLAEKRLTIVHVEWKMPAKKKKSNSDDETESKIPASFERYTQSDYWQKLIENIPENHIVAFVGAEGIPPLNELLRTLATLKVYEVVESPWEIQNYIQSRLPILSTQGANLFALKIGVNFKPKKDESQNVNFLLLENEIQKFTLLSQITEDEILENIIESVDVQNFKIIDAILSGNINETRGLFQKYLALLDRAGEVRFLNALLGAMRKTGLYMGLVGNGISPKISSELLAVNAYVYQNYQKYPLSRIRAFVGFYENIIQADLFIKSGQLIGADGLLHHIESCLLKYNLTLKGG